MKNKIKKLKYPEHSSGADQARKTREKTNNLSDEQRKQCLAVAMEKINEGIS
jgi:hypothetical protein